MKRVKSMAAALAFASVAVAEAADFQIGAYCLKPYARTEQHIKEIGRASCRERV